jgi:hypothetical protein
MKLWGNSAYQSRGCGECGMFSNTDRSSDLLTDHQFYRPLTFTFYKSLLRDVSDDINFPAVASRTPLFLSAPLSEMYT